MSQKNVINCQAILFDMDGTLLDSTLASEVTWKQWAKRHGVDMAKIRMVHHGRRPEETIAIVAPSLDAKAEGKIVYDLQRECLEGVGPVAGVHRFYGAVPEDRVAIVTAADQEILEVRFKEVELKVPDVCITARLLSQGKPDPEGYLMAATKLGFNPADCVVFEDAPAGLLAAKRAGMRSVAVLTNYKIEELRKELGADFEVMWAIQDYRELRVMVNGPELKIQGPEHVVL